jgi:predicted O-methyltransferase YrrM
MRYQNPELESSYRENNIGETLYDLVLEHKPKKIIEIGCLYGYSTVAMAMALDKLRRGKIEVYDLFDKYDFKHCSLSETASNIGNYGLSQYVDLYYGDLDKWLKNPEPFDLLHVDVSNTGDVIKRVYEATKDQIAKGSVVIFEGGSQERDEVPWMRIFGKKPINGCGVAYKILNPMFPSLSQIL